MDSELLSPYSDKKSAGNFGNLTVLLGNLLRRQTLAKAPMSCRLKILVGNIPSSSSPSPSLALSRPLPLPFLPPPRLETAASQPRILRRRHRRTPPRGFRSQTLWMTAPNARRRENGSLFPRLFSRWGIPSSGRRRSAAFSLCSDHFLNDKLKNCDRSITALHAGEFSKSRKLEAMAISSRRTLYIHPIPSFQNGLQKLNKQPAISQLIAGGFKRLKIRFQEGDLRAKSRSEKHRVEAMEGGGELFEDEEQEGFCIG
nr:hypothetical protein Iba_chr08bCG13020 [Ipomoea batatas]